MKIIDFETIKEFGKTLSSQEILDWTRSTFINKDQIQMPVKTRLHQPGSDYYACMPCLWEEKNTAMAKMIGRHSIKRNEDRSVMLSDLMLFEADTGILKALMDAEYLTTLRTGATAALSALLYAREDFETIGLIGFGNIMSAFGDIFFDACRGRKLKVKVYGYKGQEQRFMNRYRQFSNLEFEVVDSYEKVMQNSDLIVSALTAADHDFADVSCYKDGVTVIPIMTLGFQNCDTVFDKIFTDEIEQIRGFRYFNEFRSVANTDQVLKGLVPGRQNDKERILVYNYGLSSLDLVFAQNIYDRLQAGIPDTEYRYNREKYFM